MDEKSELKISVHAQPLRDLHMSDYDFKCIFYTSRVLQSHKAVTLKKEELIKVDNDNYYACLTSEMAKKLGAGKVMLDFIAYIPDIDFPDGLRTEIKKGITCSNAIID